MKKAKLLATVAVAASAFFAGHASVSAQTIGFKVGPTFSKINSSEDNSGSKSLTSFGGGGFLRFGMMGLAMQGEALAMTKGVAFEDTGVTGKLKVTYLEIPVLARFGGGTGPMAPYLMVGPSFAFQLSCKASFEGLGVTDSGNCDDGSDTATFKKFDIGATGVVGVEFKMGPGALLLEGRYTHGLMNINEDDTAGNGGKLTNRSFAAMAGYAFTMR